MELEQVTEGELAILEQIWKNDKATSRVIADALYEKVTDSKLASVQKLLERLESKACLLYTSPSPRDRG